MVPAESAKQEGKLYWPAVMILVFYPLLLIGFGVAYVQHYSFGVFEVVMLLMGHYLTNISVGVGLHRLWAHSAFKVNRFVEFFLAVFTAGALQGPVLTWVSDHQKHHTYTDEALDPHSPFKYKNKVVGFFWAHVGWMLFKNSFYIDRATMKRLGQNPILAWQLKNYYQIAIFMNLVVPMVLGYLLGDGLQGALGAFIFLGLGRVYQQHMTFSVNSVCHLLGSHKYANSTAGDIWWLFFLLLGENWHNFHHAFARDYRNGWKWYQADIHKWVIFLMSKLGLAWDLVTTPAERIHAKQQEAQSQIMAKLHANLKAIEAAARRIAESSRQKLINAEKSAHQLADSAKIKLKRIELSAQQLAAKMQHYAAEINLTEELVVQATKKLRALEKVAKGFGIYCAGSSN